MRPGGQRAHQESLIAVHAEHDDADIRIALDNLRSGVDSIELRHSNVHYYDIGAELLGHPDRLAPIRCLANDFDLGIGLEEEPKALSDHAVVVCEEHFSTEGHMFPSTDRALC